MLGSWLAHDELSHVEAEAGARRTDYRLGRVKAHETFLTPISAQTDARHAVKMAKKKAARDKIMATKSGDKGLIIVHTGAGKGKSSSGFGMILRCIAHDMPCAVVQFIKGGWQPGEAKALELFGDALAWHALGEGFTWETQDRERDRALVQAAWEQSRSYLADASRKLVVLDEVNVALKLGYLSLEQVLEGLALRPELVARAPLSLLEARLLAEMDREEQTWGCLPMNPPRVPLGDRKSTRLNSSHEIPSRMPSSA